MCTIVHTVVSLCTSVSRHVCRQAPKSVRWDAGMSPSVCISLSSLPPSFINSKRRYQRGLLYFRGQDWLIHSASSFPIHYVLFPLMNRLSLWHSFFPLCLHLSTFILSFPLSHSSSHILRLPSRNTCGQPQRLMQEKGRGGWREGRKEWEEAVLQTNIHPVPVQSSNIPSWCFNTNVA